MASRIIRLASAHGLIATTVLTGVVGAVLWTILSSGNPWAGLAGLLFGFVLGPPIYWRTKGDEQREASKYAEKPTPEEIQVLEDYRSSPDSRWRRLLFLILPLAGALAALGATNLLFHAERLTVVGIISGLCLGMLVAVRWFSAAAYLKSKNPTGRPQ